MIAGHQCMFAGASSETDKLILKLDQGMDLRSDVMMPDGDMTIAFWYKGYSRGANNEVWQFGWLDAGGWGGSRGQFKTSDYVARYATGSSASEYNISAAGAYAIDQTWRHFAWRKSGEVLDVLVNGLVIASATPGVHKNDGTPLSIGSLGNDSDSQPSRGVKSIGFFCLFGRALNDDEINSLAGMRTIRTGRALFADLICGYELSSDTLLTDVTGNYPLAMHNSYGLEVEYTDLLPQNPNQLTP